MMTYAFRVLKDTEIEEDGNTFSLREGDLIEIMLRVSQYDEFKKDNPYLERYFTEPPAFRFVDMVQPDGRFMERMGSIQRNYPGAKRMFDGTRFRPKAEW